MSLGGIMDAMKGATTGTNLVGQSVNDATDGAMKLAQGLDAERAKVAQPPPALPQLPSFTMGPAPMGSDRYAKYYGG